MANYGSLSARAHAEFAGEYTNLNTTGSDGFGIADEGFTITSPSVANGQSGTVVFTITVTGGFSTTSNSQVGVQLSNRANGLAGGQPFQLFNCYLAGSATEVPTIYSWAGDDLSGFNRSPGAMSGSDQITSAPVPMVFGTSFDYKFGLMVEAVSALTSIVDSDFEAAITGIQVKGPGGVPVTDFVIVSASGTPYGASGATAVGEPAPDGIGGTAQLSAFPNPTRGDVELRFALPRPVAPRVEIYDSTGRRVRGLDDANAREGAQSVLWDGRNDHGALVPSGVYFARVSWQDQSATTRVTLLR
ncbi:MAG: FlgD immunoglobulin-like domain containing protein [bacterium]